MRRELIKRIISSIIFLPLVIFVIIKGTYFFNIILALCFFISIYEWYNMSKKKNYFLIGIFFLVFSFTTIYQIRFSLDYGYMYLLLILVVCVGSDIGGFIFGKILKGPKLTKISPNKTYAGMFGSFILPVLVVFLTSKNVGSIFLLDFNFKIIFFVLFISLISQLGDLIISYFKRIKKIKDTGYLIPGHGGLLDRIDGMIFAFPFSYLVVLIMNINIF